MTAETFCELLGEINEKHIVQAAAAGRPEKRLRSKRWAVAACVCLLAVAAIGGRSLLSAAEPYPAQWHETLAPDTPEQPATLASAAPARTPWTLRFNEPGAVLGAQRPMIKGIFTEALHAEELAALQPQLRLSYMTCSGYAEFDTYGTLLRVVMRVATTLPERPVTVSVGDYAFDALDSQRDEAAGSVCGGVEFRAFCMIPAPLSRWLRMPLSTISCSASRWLRKSRSLSGQRRTSKMCWSALRTMMQGCPT